MSLIDLFSIFFSICFILCLFSLGFKLLETARNEESFENELHLAEEEIKTLKGEVDYLKSYVEHLRVQITRMK